MKNFTVQSKTWILIGFTFMILNTTYSKEILAEFNSNDATLNIADAIDSAEPGDTVTIPYTGQTWWVSPSSSKTANVAIALKVENMVFQLEEGVVVRARHGDGHFLNKNSKLIRVDADGVIIKGLGSGAVLQMEGKSYLEGAYGNQGGSSFRHAIRIQTNSNIKIENLTIIGAGSDGISIGKGSSETIVPSDISVDNVLISGSVRLGMAITSGIAITVKNSIFEKSDGEFPMAGIDIEPNHHDPDQVLDDIVIENVLVRNNAQNGFQVGLFNFFNELGKEVQPVDITFRNCQSIDNGRWGFHSSNSKGEEAGNGVRGKISIERMYIEGSGEHGMQFSGYRFGDAPEVDIAGLTINNCGTLGEGFYPIYLKGQKQGYKLGGIDFRNYRYGLPKIIDTEFERPAITADTFAIIGDTKGFQNINGLFLLDSKSKQLFELGDGSNWENVHLRAFNVRLERWLALWRNRQCWFARPEAPEATASAHDCHEVLLVWDHQPCTKDYSILRKTDSTDFVVIAQGLDDIYFTDSTTTAETNYVYRVQGNNRYGATNSQDIIIQTPICKEDIDPCEFELPSPPEVLTIDAQSCNAVSISWKTSQCAEEYLVRRWTDPSAKESLGFTTDSTYTDTTALENTNYTYIVRAFNALGAVSSSEQIVTTPPCGSCDDLLPLIPQNFTASLGECSVELKWDTVSCAASYDILRGDNGDSLTLLVTITDLSYSDTTVLSETEYEYAVRATNSLGSSTTEPLAITTGRCGDGLDCSVDPPEVLIVEVMSPACEQVIVSWNSAQCAEEYIIRRWIDATMKETIATITDTLFIDSTVVGGSTYTYLVRAKNENGVVNSNTPSVFVENCDADSSAVRQIPETETISNLDHTILYPNPARNKLYLGSNLDIRSYTIHDMSGRLLLQVESSDSEINISGLPKGVYMIHLTFSSNKTELLKFMKVEE